MAWLSDASKAVVASGIEETRTHAVSVVWGALGFFLARWLELSKTDTILGVLVILLLAELGGAWIVGKAKLADALTSAAEGQRSTYGEARYAEPQPRVTREAYRMTEQLKASRIFAPQSLSEMCGEIARSPTSYARRETAAKFHGLWVHVLGNVRDIVPDDGSDVVQVPLFVPGDNIQVTLFLELKWRQFVLNLKPGTDAIEANGRIEQIYQSVAVLAPVEMLAHGPPDKMAQI
jgi:hypothetical protein